MKTPILSVKPLGFPWETTDPFLTCVYHQDAYPAGNEALGPATPLTGRRLGSDFEGKDGWRMYHGEVVPGFPQHPHRGFETVTIVRKGFVDHSDSLGATARYGQGDVQWLTAGKGINHAEMFPLLQRDRANPLELFQIWVNLPRESKLVEPHFRMFWSESIPVVRSGGTEVTVIAGGHGGLRAPAPPPKSWAAQPDADVAIWTIKLAPGARWTLPPARPGTVRTLYLFRGGPLTIGGTPVPPSVAVTLAGEREAEISNGADEAELLLLQGRPIGEPVAQYGPFVMNTSQEIQQAFLDYRRTGFGGWPWPSNAPVHPLTDGRFAVHADGTIERAPVPAPL